MKRYVMTKDKTIYDTTKMPTVNFDLDASVDKTSDNLLDLLEVGDLVELEPPHEYFIIKNEFYKKSAMDRQFNVDFNIKAIWKRNGDIMRRYEI